MGSHMVTVSIDWKRTQVCLSALSWAEKDAACPSVRVCIISSYPSMSGTIILGSMNGKCQSEYWPIYWLLKHCPTAAYYYLALLPSVSATQRGDKFVSNAYEVCITA